MHALQIEVSFLLEHEFLIKKSSFSASQISAEAAYRSSNPILPSSLRRTKKLSRTKFTFDKVSRLSAYTFYADFHDGDVMSFYHPQMNSVCTHNSIIVFDRLSMERASREWRKKAFVNILVAFSFSTPVSEHSQSSYTMWYDGRKTETVNDSFGCVVNGTSGLLLS